MAQAEIKPNDIENAQAELLDIVRRMNGTTDIDELRALGQEIQAATATIQTLALSWQSQVRASAGLDTTSDDPNLDGISTVVLTDRQRQLVFEDTGLALAEVDLDGPVWPMTLPSVQPKTIDHAIMSAAREKAAVQQATSPLADRIDQIRNGKDDALKEMLNKALEDPDFLGGALSD